MSHSSWEATNHDHRSSDQVPGGGGPDGAARVLRRGRQRQDHTVLVPGDRPACGFHPGQRCAHDTQRSAQLCGQIRVYWYRPRLGNVQHCWGHSRSGRQANWWAYIFFISYGYFNSCNFLFNIILHLYWVSSVLFLFLDIKLPYFICKISYPITILYLLWIIGSCD